MDFRYGSRRGGARLALCGLLFAACGGAVGGGDPSGADATVAEDGTTPPAGDAIAGCALEGSLAGRTFRFDTFVVTAPRGPENALAATLTSLWEVEIANEGLNIVLRVVSHDPAEGVLQVEAGTAFRDPDTGRLTMVATPPAGVLDLRLDGCAFRSLQPGRLPVFPDLLAVPLAIEDVSIEGVFAGDGARIEHGVLRGGICRDMAAVQFFKPVPGAEGCLNLKSFMDDLGIAPDRDDLACEDAAGGGYTFEGTFSAGDEAAMAAGAADPTRVFSCGGSGG